MNKSKLRLKTTNEFLIIELLLVLVLASVSGIAFPSVFLDPEVALTTPNVIVLILLGIIVLLLAIQVLISKKHDKSEEVRNNVAE